MIQSSEIIKILNLEPHPEGGFYRETYRAEESTEELPMRYKGTRNFSTAIYFMLTSETFSAFHRLKSDELWHFHSGSPLKLYVIKQNGQLYEQILGPDLRSNQHFQLIIPRNCWFAAEVIKPDNYTLMSCTVAPGFDFSDFELAKRESLLKQYPQHKEIIFKMTRQ